MGVCGVRGREGGLGGIVFLVCKITEAWSKGEQGNWIFDTNKPYFQAEITKYSKDFATDTQRAKPFAIWSIKFKGFQITYAFCLNNWLCGCLMFVLYSLCCVCLMFVLYSLCCMFDVFVSCLTCIRYFVRHTNKFKSQ